MNFPEELKYTSSHEWLKIDGSTVTVGITDHAQSELGDVVFVELPDVGSEFAKEAGFGTIEAVKTVADLYAPVSGKVLEVNSALQDDAAVINTDPYGEGWIVKFEAPSLDGEFMDAAAYKASIGQ